MNKKTVRISAVIILVILVLGVYLFENNNLVNNVKENQEAQNGNLNSEKQITRQITKEEYEAIVSNQSYSKSSLSGQSKNSYEYVQSRDKAKCSELENEYFRNNCITGIDLMNTALAQNNSDLCLDRSYQLEERFRILCLKQFAINES